MPNEMEWGLTACRAAGGTSIALDESITDDILYEFEIEKPQWSMRCRVAGTEVIWQVVAFLTTQTVDELQLGHCAEHPVTLRRDDEFEGRFFLVMESPCGRARITIAGEHEIGELVSALRAAIEDI